ALELDLAHDELVEHLLLDDGGRRQRTALLGRLLLLLLVQILEDEIDALGELALQNDAFVDDGCDAVEQLSAGAEPALLRGRGGHPVGQHDACGGEQATFAKNAHGIALLNRLGRCCGSPEYHGRAARPATSRAATNL